MQPAAQRAAALQAPELGAPRSPVQSNQPSRRIFAAAPGRRTAGSCSASACKSGGEVFADPNWSPSALGSAPQCCSTTAHRCARVCAVTRANWSSKQTVHRHSSNKKRLENAVKKEALAFTISTGAVVVAQARPASMEHTKCSSGPSCGREERAGSAGRKHCGGSVGGCNAKACPAWCNAAHSHRRSSTASQLHV